MEDHVGGMSLTRPSSSVTPLSSHGNVKASERSTSARTKHVGRLKLAPLASGDRLRTPNVVNFLMFYLSLYRHLYVLGLGPVVFCFNRFSAVLVYLCFDST